MEFIKDSSIIPVPFNILTLPFTFASFTKRVLTRCKKKLTSNSFSNSNQIEMGPINKTNGSANGSTLPGKMVRIIYIFRE